MTPDSTTDQLQNKTLWSSYTEIIDVKQATRTRHWSASGGSEQFGSQQVSVIIISRAHSAGAVEL
ncbi:host specificity J domain protein [Escherichia coli 2731150]|nr:host specificity J domain protein [Escherichia coli 2731150]